MRDQQRYLPALRFRYLTRFYDRLVGALLREESLKRRLVHQAAVGPGHRVLDVGCGTATLTLLAQQEASLAVIVGLDADLETLVLARRKAASRKAPLRLCVALGQELPFADDTFDRVVSSLFFHHLTRSAKRAVLSAIGKVLRSKGELLVLDWGRAHDPMMRLMFFLVQLLDGFATTADNVRGRLLELMQEAGFDSAREAYRERSLLGMLSLYRTR